MSTDHNLNYLSTQGYPRQVHRLLGGQPGRSPAVRYPRLPPFPLQDGQESVSKGFRGKEGARKAVGCAESQVNKGKKRKTGRIGRFTTRGL